jgi:hypothetical protein
MVDLIDSIGHGIPASMTEVATLGRTVKRRASDVLAQLDRPQTSNGPTEAINGRLEHLPGIALGFRTLSQSIPDVCQEPADSDPTTPRVVTSRIPSVSRLSTDLCEARFLSYVRSILGVSGDQGRGGHGGVGGVPAGAKARGDPAVAAHRPPGGVR